MADKKHPAWFKVYVNNQNIFKNLDDAAVGRGFKLAFDYIATNTVPETDDPIARAVFEVLKSGLDETIQSYEMSIAYGRKGADVRYGR